MTPPEFRELVGAFSNLGADNDFVRAAVEREAEERHRLDRERIQAVADDARRRAADWVWAPAKEGGETRGLSPDAAFISMALAKRLEPWAAELREEGFGKPSAPFPEDPMAAAEWIEMQSKKDSEQLLRQGVAMLDAQEVREWLADMSKWVARIEGVPPLWYIRPNVEYKQRAWTYPGTFLDRLQEQTNRVAEKTAFRPEVLTGFVLTGLRPMISRVRIRKTAGGCTVTGDFIPCRSVTLEFYAADISYEEIRSLYAEIRGFFGTADKERLSWTEFDFISLVDSMGGPPEQGKTRFWEEVQRRWKEMPASRHSPMGSWRAARNKYARLDSRKNLREWTMPNSGMPNLEGLFAL